MQKSTILLFLFLNAIISIIFYYRIIDDQRRQYLVENGKKKYGENNKYIINNKVAQYSTFIVVDQDDLNKIEYRIEAYIYLNYRYVERFGPKENFLCLIKFINKINNSEKIIEIESSESFRNSKMIYNKKVFFLDLDNFGNNTDTQYLLDNLYVAVIWKNDFNKTLHMDGLVKIINTLKVNQTAEFPYSLIKFQKPDVIKNIQPRSKSVGLCVHYTYEIPNQIIEWLDIQLEIGIAEIMFYDAIENNNLTKLLHSKYNNDKRIVVKPYNIYLDDICNEKVLFEQFIGIGFPKEVRKYLIKDCSEFFESQFLKRYELRIFHEKITSNDCYTILSQKHELIGYYDLDEFVFPRTLDLLEDFSKKNNYYSCSSNSSKAICDSNPFYFKNSSNNKIYNYLNSIITELSKNRSMDDFIAVYFYHASFLTPNEVETSFMKDLKSIVDDFDNGKDIFFPLILKLHDPVREAAHIFLIHFHQLEHIRFLLKSYYSFIPCIYNQTLKNIKTLETSLIRHLYYITEDLERLGKAFCYYKNIAALTPHGADFDKRKW